MHHNSRCSGHRAAATTHRCWHPGACPRGSSSNSSACGRAGACLLATSRVRHVCGALGLAGISAASLASTPSLRNLNEDPLISGCLAYFLKAGVTALGGRN